MSYSKSSDDNIVLTMTRDDYSRLLIAMGMAVGAALGRGMLNTKEVIKLLNRINEGNPNYSPYQVP